MLPVKLDRLFRHHTKHGKHYKKKCKISPQLLCIAIIFIQLLIITVFIISDDTTSTHSLQSKLNSMAMDMNSYRDSMRETDYELADRLYPDHGDNETIFIAIASYRDPECVQTILNIFETAKYPDRLRFGIFQQHNISDVDCMDFHRHIDCTDAQRHPVCGRMWQIKIDREHYSDAKGPMYGRYRTELYYKNESYLMQIDAHSRFVPYWDNICIDMFKRTGNEKAVLTTYPKAVIFENNWTPPVPRDVDDVIVIPQTRMANNHMFKHDRGNDSPNPGKSVLAPFFAAGFSFQSGQRVIDVPSDPYLPYLFDGEEISMGVRMWTSGYDIYVPDRDIVYHIYSMKLRKGESRHLFWELGPKERHRKYAEYRILHVLKLFDKYVPHLTTHSIDLREIDKYGLGTERDIDDFWKWIKMDWGALRSGHLRMQILQEKLERIPTYSELVV
eukprot:407522_1